MTPKRDLAGKTEPAAKKSSRKTITIEQKVDIIRWYERGEHTHKPLSLSRVFFMIIHLSLFIYLFFLDFTLFKCFRISSYT